MGRRRIGRGDDPRRQRQPRPGRGIDVGEDRRRPAHGPRPGRRPQASGASGSHQPRSCPTCTSRGTSTRRTSAATPAARSSDGRLRGVELEPGIGLVVEPLGERRLPVPCRLGRPSLAPGQRASPPGPPDAHRPARSGPRSAARPDTRRSRHRPSRASGPWRTGARACRRAAPPRRARSWSRSGGRAGPRRANRRRAGTRSDRARTWRPARGAASVTAASHARSPVPGGSGTLTLVPAATPSPTSSTSPVPGNSARPVSWKETVSTPGSSQWIACTPSP